MKRDLIQQKVSKLVRQFDTNDPFKLCKSLNVPIYYHNIGSNIMGYSTIVNRIPAIILNTRNTDREQIYVCSHELGHNQCNHKDNTGFLQRNHLNVKTYGIEYEANCFMSDLLLERSEPYEFETRDALLECYGVPAWASDAVNWDYLRNK